MAVEMTIKGQTPEATGEFFQKLDNHAVSHRYAAISKAGYKVEIQWQAVKLTSPSGHASMVTPLPFNTTAVFKGTLKQQERLAMAEALMNAMSPKVVSKMNIGASKAGVPLGKLIDVLQHAKNYPIQAAMSDEFAAVSAALDQIGATPPPKEYEAVVAKYEAEKAHKAPIITAKPAPEIPIGPVPLAAAVALSQSVKGSDPDSIYKVIALGPRVRMAARLKGTKLSVRVEGPINSTERSALQQMGFSDKGGHFSCHFSLNTCPAERIIGCLFFNPDVSLTQKIASLKEAAGGV